MRVNQVVTNDSNPNIEGKVMLRIMFNYVFFDLDGSYYLRVVLQQVWIS
ncbi:unnamed protein product [Acanthoscelides obtectus]|uniref:Uncharacterized protein n=1 Tax=Acanthoscelides obtectus TaxID=200917 RepID=A0A9P0L413_ACAOB|nr:unnamed protein product [Acanthoscelides obtectus]CAK1635138.1 hypothetical protein AOBTE_LOCUS9091 [Acanthoscelides obtectus]